MGGFYVLPDGAGIIPWIPSDGEASRMFASMLGASRHVDAPPVTPIKSIKRIAAYDARDVMANNWRVDGLRATYITQIEIEGA